MDITLPLVKEKGEGRESVSGCIYVISLSANTRNSPGDGSQENIWVGGDGLGGREIYLLVLLNFECNDHVMC